MNETAIMRAIREAVNLTPGCRCWRNHTGKVQAKDGTWHSFGLGVGSPDLVGIAYGRLLGIEVKTATGRIRPEQRAWLEAVTRLGGVVGVCRSVDEALALVQSAKSAP